MGVLGDFIYDDLADVTGDKSYLKKKTPAAPPQQSEGWWTPDRVNQAVNHLQQNARLSSMGAKGLVARWAGVEAKGGPNSVNPTSGAIGIGQWLGNRKNGLPSDFEGQLNHAVKELNSTESAAAKRLRTAQTPEEAATGASMFERAEGYDPKTGRDNFIEPTLKTLAKFGVTSEPRDYSFLSKDIQDIVGSKDYSFLHQDLQDVLGNVERPTDSKGRPFALPSDNKGGQPISPTVQGTQTVNPVQPEIPNLDNQVQELSHIGEAAKIGAAYAKQIQSGGTGGVKRPLGTQVNASALDKNPVVPPTLSDQESQANDKEIPTDFTRTVSFADKPDGVDNKEYFVQKLVPQLASDLNADAQDVEKALRDSTFETIGKGLEKGTPLSKVGKGDTFNFKMSPGFLDDVTRNHEARLGAARQSILEGNATGDLEGGQQQALKYGLGADDIQNILTDPGFQKEAQEKKQTYEANLKDFTDNGVANPDVIAKMATGFLSKDQATKEIDNRTKEATAQKEAEDAAGYGDPEYLASHSQAYQEWKQGILKQYGSFTNLKDKQAELAPSLDPNARPLARALNAVTPANWLFGTGGDYAEAKDIEELYKKQNALSDQERKIKDFGTGLQAFLPPDPLTQFHAGVASRLAPFALNALATITRFGGPLSTWMSDGKGSFSDAANWLDRAAEQTRIIGEASKPNEDTLSGQIASYPRQGGEMVGDIIPIAGATVLSGGNPAVGFALATALQNSGKPWNKQLQGITKSGGIGLVFEGQPIIEGLTGKLFDSVVDKLGLDTAATSTKILDTLVKKGTPIGFLGGTGALQAAAEGGSGKDIRNSAVQMALLGLAGSAFGHEPKGKELDLMDNKVYRVPDENNKPIDVLVTKDADGNHVVTDVTGNVPEGVQQAVVGPSQGNKLAKQKGVPIPDAELKPAVEPKSTYDKTQEDATKPVPTKAEKEAAIVQSGKDTENEVPFTDGTKGTVDENGMIQIPETPTKPKAKTTDTVSADEPNKASVAPKKAEKAPEPVSEAKPTPEVKETSDIGQQVYSPITKKTGTLYYDEKLKQTRVKTGETSSAAYNPKFWEPVEDSGASSSPKGVKTATKPIVTPAEKTPEVKVPQTPKGYGAKNKIVTQERATELRAELSKKLKESGRTASTGLPVDPETAKLAAEYAVYHIEAGARTLNEFTHRMIQEVGEHIKPYAKGLWAQGHKLIEEAKKTGQDYIDTWHGTPHRFNAEIKAKDPKGNIEYLVGEGTKMPRIPQGWTKLEEYPLGRFRGDKLLTGEGAAAYGVGKGGYHAEKKGVATDYQRNLGGDAVVQYQGKPVHAFRRGGDAIDDVETYMADWGHTPKEAIEEAKQTAKDDLETITGSKTREGFTHYLIREVEEREKLQEKIAALDKLNPDDFKLTGGSTLYKTRIKAKESEFLHWDKPLSEQPEKIRRHIEKDEDLDIPENATGSEVYRELTRQLGSAEDVSAYLNDEGIKGIKFADGSSRNLPDTSITYEGKPLDNYLAKALSRGTDKRADVIYDIGDRLQRNPNEDVPTAIENYKKNIQYLLDKDKEKGLELNPHNVERMKAIGQLNPDAFERIPSKKTHNRVVFNPEDVQVTHAWGADNKIITPEKFEKVKQIISTQLRESTRVASSGLPVDPKLAKALIDYGTFHAEAGARKFGEWSKKMVDDLGDVVKPYLEAIHAEIKKQYKFTGMGESKAETADRVSVKPEPKETPEPIKSIKFAKGTVTGEPKQTIPLKEEGNRSKIGKSIEQKAIEKGLAESFDQTVEYDAKTVKDQAAKVSTLITSDPDRVHNIVRGTEALPSDINPAMFIDGVERYADQIGGDKGLQLKYDLANSDVVKKTSEAAQTLRFTQEREQDSVTQMLQDIRKSRQDALKKTLKGRDINDVIKEEAEKLAKTFKPIVAKAKKAVSTRETWTNFISKLEC